MRAKASLRRWACWLGWHQWRIENYPPLAVAVRCLHERGRLPDDVLCCRRCGKRVIQRGGVEVRD